MRAEHELPQGDACGFWDPRCIHMAMRRPNSYGCSSQLGRPSIATRGCGRSRGACQQDASPPLVGVPECGLGIGHTILEKGGAPAVESCPDADDSEKCLVVPYRGRHLPSERLHGHATLWKVMGVPTCDEAFATTWWRWSGHVGRLETLEPSRWVSGAVAWRDAWWLCTVRARRGNGRAEDVVGMPGSKAPRTSMKRPIGELFQRMAGSGRPSDQSPCNDCSDEVLRFLVCRDIGTTCVPHPTDTIQVTVGFRRPESCRIRNCVCAYVHL